MELVGTRFRLHGRNRHSGLDCVGVLAEALACAGCPLEIPHDYTLRGLHLGKILAFFDRPCFRAVAKHYPANGDLLLCQSAEQQMHFAIIVPPGIVHAHAGLRRVVLTPLPAPWPIIGQWRYIGD